MASAFGKILVGGGAVYFSYRVSNSLIENSSQKNKYSIKSINERLKSRSKDIEFKRNSLLEKASSETFDVVIVGGNYKAAQVALDCSAANLKTLLIDKQDFNSEFKDDVQLDKDIGSYGMLMNIPSRTENLHELYDYYCSIGSEYSLLNTAPYLASPMKTIIYFPCMFSSILGYVKHKLSDIIVNKPPKYCAKFTRFVPAWYSENSTLGGIEVNQISMDNPRLNLVTILTSANFGAIPLNYVELLNVETENDEMVISIRDKISNNVLKTRTKKIISIKQKECNEDSSVHCFQLAQNLMDKNLNCCFSEEGILIKKNFNKDCYEACVASCSDHREAFQKLKNIISKFQILRKGEVKTLKNVSTKTEFLWEVISSHEKYTVNSILNPVTRRKVNSNVLLLGSHGWHPDLSTVISNKYGLPEQLCNYLVRKYGDLGPELARKVTMCDYETQEQALMEVETVQGCKEMCFTVTDMCNRLNVNEEKDIRFVAGIMQKHLQWTRKDTEKQILEAKNERQSLKITEEWKSSLSSNKYEADTGFLKSQQEFFKRNAKESGVLYQWQLEELMKNSDSSLNEDMLNDALRNADIEKNGQVSKEEFLAVMLLLHVKSPKEVIEKHIENIKKEI